MPDDDSMEERNVYLKAQQKDDPYQRVSLEGQYPAKELINPQWTIEKQEDGSFRIKNVGNVKYLGCDSSTCVKGDAVTAQAAPFGWNLLSSIEGFIWSSVPLLSLSNSRYPKHHTTLVSRFHKRPYLLVPLAIWLSQAMMYV
jgi:hypothetical protein